MLCIALAAVAACSGSGDSTDETRSGPADAYNQSPSAHFTVSQSNGFAPLDIVFDGTRSADADGSIVSYLWDFGDGSSASAEASAAHTYTDTGTFDVTLQVTDDRGATDSTTRTVRVRGARISGVIRIAPGSNADSDVNDRLTTPVSNDSFGAAQPLRVPARLGGFVNTPGTGSETGNFHLTGDPHDYYFVRLNGGERIVLSIGDPSADLDLELYRDAPTPELIDASVSGDATEDLTVPEVDGEYFVRVVAVSGASNYVLSIGETSPLTATPQRAKRLTDPFVSGEVLLAEGSGEVRRHRIERGPRSRFYHIAAPARANRPLAFADVTLPADATAAPPLLDRYRTLLAAKSAQASGDVDLAEVNVLRQPLRVPNDEFYPVQWHYRAIELEAAWSISTGQNTGHPDVIVAVVDSGVLLDHPDLREQWLRDDESRVVGYDFIQDPERAGDGDGLDADPTDPGDESRADGGGSFHGTHVAGIIAAESDNGIGVAGVAWGARLMPLRALGINGGTTYDVMQAVRYAARLRNASDRLPPVAADIVNLSLGSDFYSEAEQRTLNQVRARGIFVVASAGNEARGVPTYPASYDGVISVAASTSGGTAAPYSNFGPLVDLAAPGGDGVDRIGDGRPDGVASTLGIGGGSEPPELGYGILQGTSMAAPHVSGVIALMKSVYPALTPAQFDALLVSGQLTDDAGTPGRNDEFGWGILNARKALQAALELSDDLGGSARPILSVSTALLDFQTFLQELEFSVTNVGGAEATVNVASDQPWLRVEAASVEENGTGRYRARVDRSGLNDGTYTGTIAVTADDPAVSARSIRIVLLVASPDVDADAGQHYVILQDADDHSTVTAQIVTAEAGEYRFELEDVGPGRYLLFAGTDLNDDDFICDGGEACGAYPSLTSPRVITVDPRTQPVIADVSFVSEFRTTATITTGAPGASVEPEGSPAPGRQRLHIEKSTARPVGDDLGADHEP
jgi:serine protease